jgi:hypothetical protein
MAVHVHNTHLVRGKVYVFSGTAGGHGWRITQYVLAAPHSGNHALKQAQYWRYANYNTACIAWRKVRRA